MNQDLIDFIQSDTPKLNPLLAESLSYHHMKSTEEYLDSVFRAVLKDLEDSAGFYYLGFERVTPLEEFVETTKGKNNGPRQYNMARTDTYMIKLKFRHQDVEYEKFLSIPFSTIGGLMHVHGTLYSVTPVLADKVISVTPPKIFVRLLSVRLNFEKENYQFIADGIRQTYPVVKSEVYKTKDKKGKKFVPDTPMVFYLLCQCGVTEMFKRYLDCDVKYGIYTDEKNPIFLDTGELIPEEYIINETKYPASDYVICRSSGQKHRKLKVREYVSCDVAVVIPRSKYTETMKCVMAGLYFVLDQFYDEISLDSYDDVNTWRVCLGKVLFNHNVNPGKLLTDVNDHLSSVDQYIDEIMKVKFKRINLHIEDMYQLFFLLIDKFEDWQNQYINKESDLYNKELSVLYYILGDLTRQMVNFNYQIKKKNKGQPIKERDVKDAIRSKIKTDAFQNVKNDHGEVAVVNYSGDNMAFGVTHMLVAQDKTSKRNSRSESVNLEDPTKRLHVSMPEVRTAWGMAKTAPDGSSRLNLHMLIDYEGGIIRNPDMVELLDNVQKELTRN